MTRHGLTEQDQATPETCSTSTAAPWQEEVKALHVRTRIRAGVCVCGEPTEIQQPALLTELPSPM